jgi:hypothetical protein
LINNNIFIENCNKALLEAENAVKMEGLSERQQLAQKTLKNWMIKDFRKCLHECKDFTSKDFGKPAVATLSIKLRSLNDKYKSLLRHCDVINDVKAYERIDKTEYPESGIEDYIAELEINEDSIRILTDEDFDTMNELQKTVMKEVECTEAASELYKTSMPQSPEEKDRIASMRKTAEELKEFIENHKKPVMPMRKVKKCSFSMRRPRTQARSRAYRSPSRSTINSSVSRDDGGGDSSDSDPPAKPYHFLVILKINKSNNHSLTVASPQLLLCGFSDRRRVA